MVALHLVGLLAACNRQSPREVEKRLEVPAAGYPVSVESSGLEKVDALVRQLISQRPATYRSGYSGASAFGNYVAPQVEGAMKELKAMGPSVFPALAKHLGDDRYSYSGVVAAWENYTVSDAVVEVLCDGHYMHSGYKWRTTPSGGEGYLSFNDYLKARGYETWPEWARTRTRIEIQNDFIDWCIAAENARGYVDDAQRGKVLNTYEEARQRVRKQYSEQIGPANGGQPLSPDSTSTPSAAGPRR
jgi:hypothetical protein